MKLLFVSLMGGSPWGGSEKLWYETCLLGAKSGFDITVSLFDWQQKLEYHQKLSDAGVKVHLRTHPFKPELQRSSLLMRLQARVIRKNWLAIQKKKEIVTLLSKSFDVIIFSQGGPFDFLAYKEMGALFTTPAKKIIVNQVNRDNEVFDSKRIESAIKVYESIDKIVFVSHKNLKTFGFQMLKKFESKTKVIYNSFTDTSVVPNFSSSDVVQFAHVARLEVSQKGHHLLLHVLAMENWKGRNWHLNLYGGGRDLEYLQGLISFLGLDRQVTFHLHVQDLKSIWDKNNIMLLPSFFEGSSLALFESMNYGVPSVVTDVGGNMEMVIKGETAFVADAPTINSFNEAMELAWENKSHWKEMGANAKEFLTNNFNPHPEKQLLELITNV